MKRTWTAEELLEHFTLLPDELAAIGNKSGATRLGFAVLLKCLHYEGRFPRSRLEVAPDVVRFLAAQVGVDVALFAQYLWEGRTIEAHRAQIREMTKTREFRRTDEEALLDWLCTEIFDHEQHPDRLRDLIRAECRTRAIEAPDDIAALIDTGLMAYEAQIYSVIVARLAPDVQNRLDTLLIVVPDAEEEELPLSLIRHDPGPVGVESALSEIAKLRSLRAIGLPPDLFQGYTPKLVERLRRRIAAESPSHIRQHPQAIRMTLLAALVVQRTQEVTDALVTLLIQIVHRIGTRAERRVEAAYINDLKRVAGKARILYRIADAALEHPDEPVREVVFPVANEQTLRDLVAEYKAQGGAYRRHVQEVMRSSYRNHYRQILPALLDVLDFRSNNTAYQPVIQALAVVREYVESRLVWYPAESSPPLEGVICHSPSSHRGITRDKTAPHLSTLRLRASFLNAGPTWKEWDVPLRQTCIQANANVVTLEPSHDSTLDYWLKISTLEFRKQLRVPVKLADYHREVLIEKTINTSVTLNDRDTGWWLTLSYDEVVSDLTESDAPIVGVDVGVANFLTTSTGKHYGTFHGKLRERQKRDREKRRRKAKLRKCLEKKGVRSLWLPDPRRPER